MIQIHGIIGNKPKDAPKDEKYVTFIDIVSQCKNTQGEIVLEIDSIGGDVGMAIDTYNYLRGLGRPITTICKNNCASAASILFLAGDQRIAQCPIMIHNPYLAEVTGDAKELLMMGEYLAKVELTVASLYEERTGLDYKTLASFMDRESYIAPTQAVSLGFATQAKQIAFAKYNPNKKNVKNMSKAKMSVGDLIRMKLGLNSNFVVYNMALTTAEGVDLTIDREEGVPEVGDQASPDGVHTMPDGSIITVEGGAITDVTTASAEGESDAETAATEIAGIVADLQEKIADLEKQLSVAQESSKTTEEMRVLNAVRMAGGAEKVFKNIAGVYKPQGRINQPGKYKSQSSMAKRIDELKKSK